jgi:hypothetical protein
MICFDSALPNPAHWTAAKHVAAIVLSGDLFGLAVARRDDPLPVIVLATSHRLEGATLVGRVWDACARFDVRTVHVPTGQIYGVKLDRPLRVREAELDPSARAVAPLIVDAAALAAAELAASVCSRLPPPRPPMGHFEREARARDWARFRSAFW